MLIKSLVLISTSLLLTTTAIAAPTDFKQRKSKLTNVKTITPLAVPIRTPTIKQRTQKPSTSSPSDPKRESEFSFKINVLSEKDCPETKNHQQKIVVNQDLYDLAVASAYDSWSGPMPHDQNALAQALENAQILHDNRIHGNKNRWHQNNLKCSNAHYDEQSWGEIIGKEYVRLHSQYDIYIDATTNSKLIHNAQNTKASKIRDIAALRSTFNSDSAKRHDQ